MFACAFVRTTWLFGISLKYLSIAIFARTDFNVDGYRRSSLVLSYALYGAY